MIKYIYSDSDKALLDKVDKYIAEYEKQLKKDIHEDEHPSDRLSMFYQDFKRNEMIKQRDRLEFRMMPVDVEFI